MLAAQPAGDRREVGPRGIQRDVRSQPGDHGELSVVTGRGRWCHRERDPGVGVLTEPGRHHPEHGVRLPFDLNDAADDGLVRAELLPPEAVAQHDDVWRRGVGVADRAAECGRNT
jgi:hypothetical protein